LSSTSCEGLPLPGVALRVVTHFEADGQAHTESTDTIHMVTGRIVANLTFFWCGCERANRQAELHALRQLAARMTRTAAQFS
jgi:hypothetical protein